MLRGDRERKLLLRLGRLSSPARVRRGGAQCRPRRAADVALLWPSSDGRQRVPATA